MRTTIAVLAAAAAVSAGPAGALVIYSNGDGAGADGAYPFYSIQSVADSFTAGVNDKIQTIEFEVQDLVGYKPLSLHWALANGDPLTGGTVFASGNASISSFNLGTATDNPSFDLFLCTITLPNVVLTGGNFWLEFSNGVGSHSSGLYWDVSEGASSARWTVTGAVPSESFSLFGTLATPEPATWALMLTGFAGLGAMLRGRRRLAAV